MIKRISLAGGLLIAIFVLLGALLVKNVAAGPASAVRPGDVARAARQSVSDGGIDMREPIAEPGYVVGNGVVEPVDRETRVGAAVPGRVARVHVKEGDFVTTGSLLLELEDGPESAALASAEAEVAVAQATLERTAKGLRKEDIDALAADAEAARARARSSADVAVKADQLVRSQSLSTDERDRAMHQSDADNAAFKAADARRLAAANGARREDVLVARAQVTAAIGRREEARASLDRLHIHAPTDGTVLQIKPRAGEYYNTLGTDPLIVLGDTRVLRVRMDVDERDVGRVKAGAPAYVTLSAYPGDRIQGKVIELGRRMGRKNVRSDDPVERLDAKILEVVLELSKSTRLVPGIRVTAYVDAS